MESKVNYTLVGLFVIILLAATLGIIAWLTAATDTKVYDPYRVYVTESVAGLNLKASVKYKGVDVGQVTSIKLDHDNPDRVDLILEVERSTPILEDTVATLKVQGLTGLAYVELSGGSRGSPPLKAGPDQDLPVIQAGPSALTRLDNALSTVFTTFNDLSAKLDRLLNDENRAAISQILSHLSIISGALANRSGSIEQTLNNLATVTAVFANRSDSIGKSLDGAAQTLQNSARLSADLASVPARLSTGLTAFEETMRAITKTAKGLDVVVQASRRGLQPITSDAVPQVNALLAELRQLAQILERFSGELANDPRLLLFGKQPRRPGPGE
jgi:phospholipid/cholesterol/gamma-HCH transport system substrate-binding protein